MKKEGPHEQQQPPPYMHARKNLERAAAGSWMAGKIIDHVNAAFILFYLMLFHVMSSFLSFSEYGVLIKVKNESKQQSK